MTDPGYRPPSRAAREELERLATADHLALADDILGQEYLASRGIGYWTACLFRLGVHRAETGRDYLAIPYLSKAGVIARKLRRLPRERDAAGEWIEPEGPKYLALKGGGTPLYNPLGLFEDSSTLFVIEGEIDTITVMSQTGFPAAGVPGGTAWRESWNLLFGRYQDLVFVGDGDPTGEKFVARAKEFPNGRAVMMPEQEDATSFFVKHGAVALAEVLGVELELE